MPTEKSIPNTPFASHPTSTLRESERELRIKSESLEEVNSALKVLLKRVEEGQFSLEEKILSNIRELVLP
jgi:hypothetical protein